LALACDSKLNLGVHPFAVVFDQVDEAVEGLCGGDIILHAFFADVIKAFGEAFMMQSMMAIMIPFRWSVRVFLFLWSFRGFAVNASYSG